MPLPARRDSTVITVVYANGAERRVLSRSTTPRTDTGPSARHSTAITSASRGPSALPPPPDSATGPSRHPIVVLHEGSITVASLATLFPGASTEGGHRVPDSRARRGGRRDPRRRSGCAATPHRRAARVGDRPDQWSYRAARGHRLARLLPGRPRRLPDPRGGRPRPQRRHRGAGHRKRRCTGRPVATTSTSPTPSSPPAPTSKSPAGRSAPPWTTRSATAAGTSPAAWSNAAPTSTSSGTPPPWAS